MADTALVLGQALDQGKVVLLEGAQATMLDVDHGTYPFVTSSSPTAGGACAGSGIGPTRISDVIGIVKAYTTRVGEGPFPTELPDETGEWLRKAGGEYGVTTGRARRCGWFDAVIARYATRVNGITGYFLTKLDVLSGLDEVPVCVAYEVDGKRQDEIPMTQTEFHHAVPVYEYLDGWPEDISKARTSTTCRQRAGLHQGAGGDDRRPDPRGRRRPAPRPDAAAPRPAGLSFAARARLTACAFSSSVGRPRARSASGRWAMSSDRRCTRRRAIRASRQLAETHPGTEADPPPEILALARKLGRGPGGHRPGGAAGGRGRPTCCARPASPASGRTRPRPGSRARSRSPSRSWPRRASRPRRRSPAAPQPRRTRRWPRSGRPYVVKDDALAAGKGVLVTADLAAARAHARACGTVVIEEFLDGPEVSLFAVTDGATAVPLLPAQDFKRACDGDQGPNTGGMGAYAPLPWAPAGPGRAGYGPMWSQPAVDAMRRRGTPYRGLLYAGLALTSAGLRVVEFNARFGDPETQVVLDRLASPLAPLLYAAAAGDLAGVGRAAVAAGRGGDGGDRRGGIPGGAGRRG